MQTKSNLFQNRHIYLKSGKGDKINALSYSNITAQTKCFISLFLLNPTW